MSELKRKVIVYELDYLCDNCKDGFMRPTDDKKHKCKNCGTVMYLHETYPKKVSVTSEVLLW